MRRKFDVLVIGGGTAGYSAAIRAAKLGKSVALVEKEGALGGTCLHHGCIPTKALLHAASLLQEINAAGKFGISVQGLSLDWGKLQAWKDGVVRRLSQGVRFLCERNGVEVITGTARLLSPKLVRVEGPDLELEADAVVVATGSVPVELRGMEFDGERVISSTEALSLPEKPEKVLIVGGGYIGMELGTFFAAVGTEVVVVELMEQVLPGIDPELVSHVVRALPPGLEVHTGSRVLGLEKVEGGIAARVRGPDGDEFVVEAELALVTVGRRPFAEGLGLEELGVKRDERGFIAVDGRFETSVPGIYAVGDVIPGPMLAHKAHWDGKRVAEIICGHGPKERPPVPAVVFTSPEIATVGLSEPEARERGHEVAIGRFPFTASGRAITLGDSRGLVKVIAERGSKRILGVGIVGPWASELIGEASLAIHAGMTLEEFGEAIRPHPTLSEALGEAAEVPLGGAIHVLGP
ncbi:dihydrolipoyl dehydrogenase [Candidatus Bipolaricaulota sp. J31]